MHKILATATALLLVSLTIPPAHAETVSEPYTGSAGVRVFGNGIAAMCGQGCFGIEEFPNFGGAHLNSASGQVYTNVVVSVQDDVWGANAGLVVCFWNPDGDNVCDDDDYKSGFACGTVALLGSTFASDFVTAWVHTIMVTDDLEVCGGSAGVLSADLF